MSSFLSRYFDGSLDVGAIGSADELEARQVERINRALSVCLIAGTIPRRLGGDATDEELALDRKRARRMGHALAQAQRGWTRKNPTPTLNDTVRMEGAQLVWPAWSEAHLAGIQNELRWTATWAIRNDQEKWGNSAVVRLENELSWVGYALRD